MAHQSSKGLSAEVKVGAVTLLSLILLFAGIIIGKSVLARTGFTTITMFSASSGGVEIASPVLVNGVKRGSVTRIQPVNGGVVMTASMDNIADLHKDALARIMILEITGGRKIEITPGTAAERLAENDTVRTLYTGDLADLIAIIGEVGPDLKNIVRKLDTIANAGTALLADGKVVSDTRKALKNLSEVAESANTLVERNKGNIQTIANDLTDITRDLRQTVKTNTPKVDKLVAQLDSTLLEARKLITTGDKTVKNVDGLVKNVDDFISDARNKDNLIHKLVYDAEFNRRLDSTISHLQVFLDNLPQNGINVNVRLGSRP
ncbi:MAG: MlaD family protein [Candidatus Kapabacteria bacterium]|nr:MlaD family protein [Candidatus Kapabacteria bacterium]